MNPKFYFLFLFFSLVLFSCGDVKDISIDVDQPLKVKNDDKFIITAVITNLADKPQQLVSIDIADKYLDGFAITESEPNFTEETHIPLDNTMSYSYHKDIQPNDSIVVKMYCQALKSGDFSGEIDFCINTEFNFISKPVRTIIE